MLRKTTNNLAATYGTLWTLVGAFLLLSCSDASPSFMVSEPVCDARRCDCALNRCDYPAELMDLRVEGATHSPDYWSWSNTSQYNAEVDEKARLVVEVENPNYVKVTVGGKPVIPGRPFPLDLDELSHSFTQRVTIDVRSSFNSRQYFLNLTLRPTILTVPVDHGTGFFPVSLAITSKGRRLFVGTSQGMDGGRILVYEWDGGWWLKTSIDAPPGAGLDFGAKLTATSDGSLLLASAPHEGLNYAEWNPYRPLPLPTGAVYVIEQVQEKWKVTQRLDRTGGVAGYTFGQATAAVNSGTRIAIGSPGLKDNLEPIRIYERSGAEAPFDLTTELYSDFPVPDATSEARFFGSSLAFALQGETLVSTPMEAQSLLMHEHTAAGWKAVSLRVQDSQDDRVSWVGTPAVIADGSRMAVSAKVSSFYYSYVLVPFVHDADGWRQEAFLPCSNASFGCEVAIGAAGNLLLERNRSGLAFFFDSMLPFHGEDHETSEIWLEDDGGPNFYGELVMSSEAAVMAVVREPDTSQDNVDVYIFGTPVR